MMLRRLAGERGTAVVEFALVAPVLFLIVFGIIDFARALNYYNNLTQLAGQGARAAAVNQNPDGSPVGGPVASGSDPSCNTVSYSIQCLLAKTYTTSPEIKNSPTFTVCISQVPTTAGQPVTVKATYKFRFIPLVSGTLTLQATSTQRYEGGAPPTYTQVDQYNTACS